MLRTAYIVMGFDPVGFAVFTPRIFMCPDRAANFVTGRRLEDKASFYKIDEVPIDIVLPENQKEFYEQ
jgi:hypothetical protein